MIGPSFRLAMVSDGWEPACCHCRDASGRVNAPVKMTGLDRLGFPQLPLAIRNLLTLE
jgi:hypothetical protein